MRKRWDNDKTFAFATAVILCILVFSVFFAQVFWSDILTFQKRGDDLKSCFPALMKIAKYLDYHILQGVDTDSYNGATEFFCRPNLANHYLPVVIAGWLTKWFPNRGIYLLLYLIHMLVGAYYTTRLAQRFFQLNAKIALLLTCSWITVMMYESWYLSYYMISSLVPVAIYSQLGIFERQKYGWKETILYAFPYVLCITSGYITVSVVLMGMIFLFTAGYGVLYKNMKLSRSVIKAALPCMAAVAVCMPYLLQLLIYQKKVVESTSALSYTLGYKLNVLDLRSIVTKTFGYENPIEQIDLISLGMFWVLMVVLLACLKATEKMKREEKIILRIGTGINLLIVFISMGLTLPFVIWFYSFVPIFGSMHLPMRYLMVTLFLTYVGLALAIKYIPELKKKRFIKFLTLGLLAVGIAGLFALPYMDIVHIQKEDLMIEIFLASALLYLIYKYGLMHAATVAVSCFIILLPGLKYLYGYHEVGATKEQMAERSIVYDTDKQVMLDNYISQLTPKDRYLYSAFDSVEIVPDFLPGNYGWYGYSKYNLSNYSGYEFHLSVPKDYVERFPWFNCMDWNYIINTRGDFLVLDQNTIEANREILDKIVEWDQSGTDLDETHRILTLKKFIPSYNTGQKFVEDQPGTMENGYFYCPDLRKEQLISFQTDQATFFHAVIESDQDCVVSCLLYPNRYFHYYINGKEVEPEIHEMQAYLPIQKGTTQIEVHYENKMAETGTVLLALYYLSAAICFVWYCIRSIGMVYGQRKHQA